MNNIEIPHTVKDSIKDTVGYSEALNKASFLVGSQVAFAKSEEFYAAKIKELDNQLEYYKAKYESVDSDMKTIVSTFSKYTSNL